MLQLLAVTSAGDGAQQQVEQLHQQLEAVQSALDTAEADRQALAAQRDGWMASFQEAYGKLQARHCKRCVSRSLSVVLLCA